MKIKLKKSQNGKIHPDIKFNASSCFSRYTKDALAGDYFVKNQEKNLLFSPHRGRELNTHKNAFN